MTPYAAPRWPVSRVRIVQHAQHRVDTFLRKVAAERSVPALRRRGSATTGGEANPPPRAR
jgi:hypothetical protein